jgi:hypothetical protein
MEALHKFLQNGLICLPLWLLKMGSMVPEILNIAKLLSTSPTSQNLRNQSRILWTSTATSKFMTIPIACKVGIPLQRVGSS